LKIAHILIIFKFSTLKNAKSLLVQKVCFNFAAAKVRIFWQTAFEIMEKILILTLIIVAIAVLLLSVGIIIKGRFVNSHVSGNKYLRRKGVHCAQQQDREARRENPFAVQEKSEE